MSTLQRILVSVAATLILAVLYADAQTEVDPNCLGCLCHAASKCDATERCHVPYAGAYFCGPFHLSWAYWADAGKPIIQGDNAEVKGAFENCANDLYCAADVVREYMKKFGKDCDGDGRVTCEDIVRIHKLGKSSCGAPLPPNDKFTGQFYECAQRLQVF